MSWQTSEDSRFKSRVPCQLSLNISYSPSPCGTSNSRKQMSAQVWYFEAPSWFSQRFQQGDRFMDQRQHVGTFCLSYKESVYYSIASPHPKLRFCIKIQISGFSQKSKTVRMDWFYWSRVLAECLWLLWMRYRLCISPCQPLLPLKVYSSRFTYFKLGAWFPGILDFLAEELKLEIVQNSLAESNITYSTQGPRNL